jgi:hypothetical protein
MYFTFSLKQGEKDLIKKTWNVLKEAMNTQAYLKKD